MHLLLAEGLGNGDEHRSCQSQSCEIALLSVDYWQFTFDLNGGGHFLSCKSHGTVLKSLQARPMQSGIVINDENIADIYSIFTKLSCAFSSETSWMHNLKQVYKANQMVNE